VPLNEWLESNHRYQWFLVWQTIGSDGFSMVLVWPTIGTNGFSMVFPLETMVFQWFWVWQTIGTDGFSMVFSLETMVFQWFPMVANHWSNDGMVTIHRRGLTTYDKDVGVLAESLHLVIDQWIQYKLGKQYF